MLEPGVVPSVYVCVAESIFFVEDFEEEDFGRFESGERGRIRPRVVWLKIFLFSHLPCEDDLAEDFLPCQINGN